MNWGAIPDCHGGLLNALNTRTRYINKKIVLFPIFATISSGSTWGQETLPDCVPRDGDGRRLPRQDGNLGGGGGGTYLILLGPATCLTAALQLSIAVELRRGCQEPSQLSAVDTLLLHDVPMR